MRLVRTFIFVFLSALFGCDHTGPIDPTLNNDGFKGITYTDEQGNIVGAIDPTDWQLNKSCASYSFPGSPYCPGKTIIPHWSKARPAYPNPSNDSFTLVFRLAAAVPWSLSVIDENHRILYSALGFSEAGTLFVTWKAEDEPGHRLQSGVYRVIYRLGRFCGHGDLWFTNYIPSQSAETQTGLLLMVKD